MPECLACKKQKKEIAELKGLVQAIQIGKRGWRKLFEEQRGGPAFDLIQKLYAEEVAENIDLKNQLKEAKRVKD
jgi:hypothetical protein